jgi:hypothetical protein
MQVATESVRVVGGNPHRYGPVDLGAINPGFLVVDDDQKLRYRLGRIRTRHESILLLAFLLGHVSCIDVFLLKPMRMDRVPPLLESKR